MNVVHVDVVERQRVLVVSIQVRHGPSTDWPALTPCISRSSYCCYTRRGVSSNTPALLDEALSYYSRRSSRCVL